LRAYSAEACSGISAARLSGETIVTSCSTVTCPGVVSSQLRRSRRRGRRSRWPGFIPSTASAVTSFGAGRPGTSGRRDDDVEALDRVGQRLLLGAFSSSVSSRA